MEVAGAASTETGGFDGGQGGGQGGANALPKDTSKKKRDERLWVNGKRIYVRGVDDPCACGVDGGHHLRNDCKHNQTPPPKAGHTRVGAAAPATNADLRLEEGVCVDSAEVALAELMASGMPASLDVSEPVVGSARMLASGAPPSTDAALPPPGPPAPTQDLDEARALVASLTPSSPLKSTPTTPVGKVTGGPVEKISGSSCRPQHLDPNSGWTSST